ncbi:unnamed protein product [Heterobilharzia americana]|nr:unnamed protein product [Heterobilharzia americana]
MDSLSFCRGVLIGGLIGDCYGFLYEDKPTVNFAVPSELLGKTICGADTKQLMYTDDTQMGLGILRSVRSQNGFNPEHMAKEFATAYFEDGSHRYYGRTVGHVFPALQQANYKDPYKYATELFSGTGSYGNGGAMRAAPAALYAVRFSEHEFEKFIVDVTRLTHSHPLAVCGALIQAFALRKLFFLACDRIKLDPLLLIDYLLGRLERTTYLFVNFKDPRWKKALDAYKERFGYVRSFLLADTDPSVKDVVGRLGNNLEAINSVPTAIYVFLRCLRPVHEIEFDSVVLRCVVYSIGLGGDTDTIACMATALAGANNIGLSANNITIVPRNVITRCEHYEVIEDYAVWLSSRLQ